MPRYYPGGAPVFAPWHPQGMLFRVPVSGTTSSSCVLYVSEYGDGGTGFLVKGDLCGSLTCDGAGGPLAPAGDGEWNAGGWFFDGSTLAPSKGDTAQIEVSWSEESGGSTVTRSQYVGTDRYYRLLGFDGRARSGTANVMGAANSPDRQVTASWSYTPPQVWRHVANTEERQRSAHVCAYSVAGLYEPYAGGASGTLSLGQGVWLCSARNLAVWERGDSGGLLFEPDETGAAVPQDGGRFVLAETEGRGRFVAAGMPQRGQDFSASWEWADEVPQDERGDAPADLAFAWQGYGLLWARETPPAGAVYAYEAVRIM